MTVASIRLRRDGLKFPPECACCLARTSETRRVYVRQIEKVWGKRQVREHSLKIPYCRPCDQHAAWKKGGGIWGVLLAAIVYPILALLAAGLVGTTLVMATDWGYENEQTAWTLVVAVALVVAAIFVGLRFRNRPRGKAGRGHAREGDAVELKRYEDDFVELVVHHRDWAKKLRELNP